MPRPTAEGDRWLSDDVEAAREQINHATYPWGSGGPTPWQQWQSRVTISAEDRRLLRETIRARFTGERVTWDFATALGVSLASLSTTLAVEPDQDGKSRWA